MASRIERKGKAQGNGEDITEVAKAFFERVREIKREHPEVARGIDGREKSIRECLTEIRRHIESLPEKHEQDLVAFLVIQGISKMAEEVLVG